MNAIAIKAEGVTKIFRKAQKKSSLLDLSRIFSLKKLGISDDDHVYALKDISFDLRKGSSLGIIGNNGAGKSTLLKIIAGIMKPTSGKISIDGEISAFLDMGVALVPELTGRENIFIYGEFQGLGPGTINKLYESIASFSELGSYLNTPVKYYSTGMMMRLAFSVVAHSDKDILIFDEAFAVGDILFRYKCQKWLNNLTNNNKTIILVSHNMTEIANFCDHILLLDNGTMRISGSVGEVVKSYNELQFKKAEVNKNKSMTFNTVLDLAKREITQEIEWGEKDAPGDSQCKVLSARIINNSGTEGELPSCLTMQMHARISSFNGDIGYVISDILEHRILVERARQSASDIERKPLPDGDHELNWQIPVYLLNNGIYYVSIFMLDENENLTLRILNVISFEIVRPNEPNPLFVAPLRVTKHFSISDIK